MELNREVTLIREVGLNEESVYALVCNEEELRIVGKVTRHFIPLG